MVSGASREVIKYIHANGVGSDIHFIASLDMLKTREAPKFKLDVGFINPIIAATISTLETLSDLKPTLGKPTLRKDTASTVHDIAAILTIDAEVFSGHIAIGMDLASYRSILSRILGHAVEDDVDELASGANKILNAIYMESKTRLHAAGYTIRSARPSIMHAYQSSENATGIVVPMTVGGSTIIIEIIGESFT
jgi:CheY-specific phosphatase CheX